MTFFSCVLNIIILVGVGFIVIISVFPLLLHMIILRTHTENNILYNAFETINICSEKKKKQETEKSHKSDIYYSGNKRIARISKK